MTIYSAAAALVGKSIAMHCGDKIFACAKLVTSVSTRAKPVTPQVTPPPAPANNAVVATLPNGAGSVVLKSSTITVSVDLTQMDEATRTSAQLQACFNGGSPTTDLAWHIHDLWTHGATGGLGTDSCGGTYTGLHYDPMWACGPFSGSLPATCDPDQFCDGKKAAYSCNSTTFAADRSKCEVGDMSGRYGKMQLSEGKGFFSFNKEDNLLPPFEKLNGKSIVFHCNGKRAMCAKLVAARVENNAPPADAPTPASAAGSARVAGTGLSVAWLVCGLIFFAIFELVLLILAALVCLNMIPCIYCECCKATSSPTLHRALGITYLLLQISAICLAILVFILALASDCHGEGRCVMLITNAAFQGEMR